MSLPSLHTQITDYIASLHPLHSTYNYLEKIRDYIDIAISTLQAPSVGEARALSQGYSALEKWTEERWRDTVRNEQNKAEMMFKNCLENAKWPPKYTINQNVEIANRLAADPAFSSAWEVLMELKP
jgi:hypothetical protein